MAFSHRLEAPVEPRAAVSQLGRSGAQGRSRSAEQLSTGWGVQHESGAIPPARG